MKDLLEKYNLVLLEAAIVERLRRSNSVDPKDKENNELPFILTMT